MMNFKLCEEKNSVTDIKCISLVTKFYDEKKLTKTRKSAQDLCQF